MLMYFIFFTIIGFIIGTMIEDIKKSAIIIVSISVIWGLSNAPIWGLVTLGELSLGFFIYTIIKSQKNLEDLK